MKIWQSIMLATVAPVILGLAGNVSAGDISRGQDLSGSCAACHGADGNSSNPQWPNIAGQHENYLYEQLVNYKTGERKNALMQGQVQNLDEQDMRDLAAFYASQTMEIGSADPDLADKGEAIYRGGIADKGVAACIACHGPAGNGLEAAGFPRLGGQHATYTADQLMQYRSGERATDAGRMMRSIAERMSDDEIEAVSSYISGLHRAE